MLNQFSRTELLIGKDGIDKLQNAKVAVFGIGGVGSLKNKYLNQEAKYLSTLLKL